MIPERSLLLKVWVLFLTQYSYILRATLIWRDENETLYFRDTWPQCGQVFSIARPLTVTPVSRPVTSWGRFLMRGSFGFLISFGPKNGVRMTSRKFPSKWISWVPTFAQRKTPDDSSYCKTYQSLRSVSIIVESVSGWFAVSIRCENYFEINFDHSESRRFLSHFS